MASINPSLVPTVAPGNLFETLTTDSTLNIRWLSPTEPVFYEVLNRPTADSVLRQLIISKTVDALSLQIGNRALFPFLVQAKLAQGTSEVDLPPGWIWDLNISAPVKWENFRVARIRRTSGENLTDSYTGTLRLTITANVENSTTEVALFTADYVIDSDLTYQRCRLAVAESPEESTTIDSGEVETIGGFITFRTLSQSDPLVQAFYEFVAPPTDTTDVDGDGFFDVPSVYEILDSQPAGTGIASDFNPSPMSHGTGILIDSVENPMPLLDSDIQSWINAFNYPFDVDANRMSTGTASIEIPIGMFREFDITVPASDEATGDSSGLNSPVYISRIEVIDTTGDQLRIWFSTHNVTDDQPSLVPVEFAKLDLERTMVPGQIVSIDTMNNLRLDETTESALSNQEFGRGHVVLSSVWSGTTTTVDDFFDAFGLLPDGEATYTQTSTRISSFGLSRVPRFSPSRGEHEALAGSTDRLDTPIPPSDSNRYICESDQGDGNAVDLEAQTDIVPVDGIDRYGYTGGLAHKLVRLCVDHTKVPTGAETSAGTFYEDSILPRLTILLGRPPIFGDQWYDGTRFFTFNGDTWQG